jgi:hypothetical protein
MFLRRELDQEQSSTRQLLGPLMISGLPALIIGCSALLTMSLLALLLSMVAGTQRAYSQFGENPLDSYRRIWPGQQLNTSRAKTYEVLKTRFTCAADLLDTGNEDYVDTGNSGPAPSADPLACSFLLQDPHVHWASVSVHYNRIQELQFHTHNLDLDTLYLYWGAPDAITRGSDSGQFQLDWTYETYVVQAWVNTSQAVSIVTLTAK